MSAPKEILVEYVEPTRRQTGRFKVTAGRTRRYDFPSLSALLDFLSQHDYRHRIGRWFGAPGVWRRL